MKQPIGMKQTLAGFLILMVSACSVMQLVRGVEDMRTECYGLLDRAVRAGLDKTKADEFRKECDTAAEDAKAKIGKALDELRDRLGEMGVIT